MHSFLRVVVLGLTFGAVAGAGFGQTAASAGSAQAAQANKTASQAVSGAKTKGAAAVPSASSQTDAQIADAKSKGMVWANANTKVYHKDDAVYGKTKQGKFMTEADAQKAGYRLAKTSPIGQKKTAAAPATK